MRVMFWLSRAYAPLWWDSNYASNDPLLRHPALPAVFTCQSLEYRSAQSILSGFRVVNTIERNDFGALAPVLEHASGGCKSGCPCCRKPALKVLNANDLVCC